jgi:hypothetical protein
LTIGGYVYLTREKPLSSEAFSKEVFLVDHIIQGQLYEIGIPKKDVLLHQSSLKKEAGLAWEQSLYKIQLPRSLPFPLIEGNFRRSLSILGRPISIQSSQVSESLQLEVKVQDRTTHQLNFILPKPSTLKAGLRPKVTIVIDDLGESTTFLKNSSIGIFLSPSPSCPLHPIPKSLPWRLTERVRRLSFISLWNPVVIRKSDPGKELSSRRWTKEGSFANSPEI